MSLPHNRRRDNGSGFLNDKSPNIASSDAPSTSSSLHGSVVKTPAGSEHSIDQQDHNAAGAAARRAVHIRRRNRRKRYLDLHPEYFTSPTLELADPLLYDRLVRRFQSSAEREADGRAKGYSGVLEADLFRSEAKMHALRHPDPSLPLTYRRGAQGEILAEATGDDVPRTKAEGWRRWEKEMAVRFLSGGDGDFDYGDVDERDEFDDFGEEGRMAEEQYFGTEEESWVGGRDITGETGVQDF